MRLQRAQWEAIALIPMSPGMLSASCSGCVSALVAVSSQVMRWHPTPEDDAWKEAHIDSALAYFHVFCQYCPLAASFSE